MSASCWAISPEADVGRVRWLASVVGARLDVDVHNARRLAEHRGATPAQTLEGFRRVLTGTTAASGHTAAWLGEVVVHAQDVRRPLGLDRIPPFEVVTEVARFHAGCDFAVASSTAAKGLRLQATDGPFATLRDALGVSDPTLSKHPRALGEAGQVGLTKPVSRGRRRTWGHLTAAGRSAFAAHLAELQQMEPPPPHRRPATERCHDRCADCGVMEAWRKGAAPDRAHVRAYGLLPAARGPRTPDR